MILKYLQFVLSKTHIWMNLQLPLETNFMFIDLENLDAEEFRQAMADQGVLIRGIYRDYTNWSRVSMGMLEDVKMFVDNLPIALEKLS